MHRLFKVLFEVLTRKPNEWVQARRVAARNITKSKDLSEASYAPPEATASHEEQETTKISHRKMRHDCRDEGDKLVRKRFRTIRQAGTVIRVPVIGEDGGNKVLFWETSVMEICQDFGLGTGMYFIALKIFGTMFLLITLVNIGNMWYFNRHFSQQGETVDESLARAFMGANNLSATEAVLYAKTALLIGTAVCYDTSNVVVLQNASGGLQIETANNCRLVTILSLNAHYTLTIHSLYTLPIHPLCTHYTHPIHTPYTPTIHPLCTHYTLPMHSLYTPYTHYALSPCTLPMHS
jgi:hypothetical protein